MFRGGDGWKETVLLGRVLLLFTVDAIQVWNKSESHWSPPSRLQVIPSCQAALLLWDFLHVRRAVLRARRDHHPSPRRPRVGALGLGGQPAPQGGPG